MTASLGILITIGIALLVVLGLLVAFILIVAPTRPPSIEESPGFPIEPKTGNGKSEKYLAMLIAAYYSYSVKVDTVRMHFHATEFPIWAGIGIGILILSALMIALVLWSRSRRCGKRPPPLPPR